VSARVAWCRAHRKADSVMVEGILSRYCQQCTTMHEMKRFEGSMRSCRGKLEKHNKRRRTRLLAAGRPSSSAQLSLPASSVMNSFDSASPRATASDPREAHITCLTKPELQSPDYASAGSGLQSPSTCDAPHVRSANAKVSSFPSGHRRIQRSSMTSLGAELSAQKQLAQEDSFPESAPQYGGHSKPHLLPPAAPYPGEQQLLNAPVKASLGPTHETSLMQRETTFEQDVSDQWQEIQHPRQLQVSQFGATSPTTMQRRLDGSVIEPSSQLYSRHQGSSLRHEPEPPWTAHPLSRPTARSHDYSASFQSTTATSNFSSPYYEDIDLSHGQYMGALWGESSLPPVQSAGAVNQTTINNGRHLFQAVQPTNTGMGQTYLSPSCRYDSYGSSSFPVNHDNRPPGESPLMGFDDCAHDVNALVPPPTGPPLNGMGGFASYHRCEGLDFPACEPSTAHGAEVGQRWWPGPAGGSVGSANLYRNDQ